MALPIACRGTDGLASHAVLCTSAEEVQKQVACKTKKSTASREFLHAKSRTRIACWNVRSLGTLSNQSAPLLAAIKTMNEKRIELMALSETRWPGHGITKIRSTTILHSGTPDSRVHGVAIALSPAALSSWEATGSVFNPICERIIHIHPKTHMSFNSIIAIYAPTNPVSSTSEASAPSNAFYDQLQATLSSVPSKDMIVIMGDFNARGGSDFNTWKSVIGPHGIGEVNENGISLLDFCASNHLLITNTWFQLSHQATWYHNGDRSRPGHKIDLVLYSE